MYKLIIITIFASLAFEANGYVPPLNGRIVGGENADIKEFPHQLSLQSRGSHICGASLVSPKYAITAAHCTNGGSPQTFTIRAGSSEKGSGGVVVNVKQIFQHPSFNRLTIDFDISVLELEEELELNEKVNTIKLPVSGKDAEPGSEVVCTGWGAISEGGPSAKQLQKVIVQIVDRKKCQEDYDSEKITERMVCAGVNGGGKDACQGDSGGPLIQNGILYGVVSWGYGCARPDYPGVYTDVPNLREYIADVSGL